MLKNKKRIRIFWILSISCDFGRPWVVLVINNAQYFCNKFFEGLDVNTLRIGGRLCPKILIVKPNARLSRQYYNRRAEI